MNVQTIKNIIEQEEYAKYGLRGMMNNPITNERVIISIGDIVDNSYEWEDGEPTQEELNGTSAVEVTADTIDNAMELVDAYTWNCSQVALIASEYSEYGNDESEIIMKDAIVLAVWNI